MYKKILVPVDLEDLSVMTKVCEIVRGFLSQDQACNVRFINIQPIAPVSILGYLPPNFDEEMDRRVQADFDRLLSQSNFPDDKVTRIIRRGSVSDEILAESNDWTANMIVLGSHRPSMATYLLGSNAATIVRHAKCSVLVVR